MVQFFTNWGAQYEFILVAEAAGHFSLPVFSISDFKLCN